MTNKIKYKYFKTKILKIVIEPEFREKIEKLLLKIEENLDNELTDCIKTNKNLLKISSPKKNVECLTYYNPNHYRITILINNGTVEYEFKDESSLVDVAQYSVENGNIVTKYMKRIDSDLLYKKSDEHIVFTKDLRKIYYFRTFDQREYNIDKNGNKTLANNFGNPLVNFFLTYEYMRLSEDRWIIVETKQYYQKNMLNKNSIKYSISDGFNQNVIISEDRYNDFMNGKITEEELFKSYMNIKQRKTNFKNI